VVHGTRLVKGIARGSIEVSEAAQKLQRILGSAAFEALEAYLNERATCCVGESAPETLAPHLPVGVDAGGNLVNSEGRVICRTMTDGIRTKDGAA
jgi:hypothetical protein